MSSSTATMTAVKAPQSNKKPRAKSAKKPTKKNKKREIQQPSRLRANPNQGVQISPSRCHWWLATNGLNRAYELAIHELKNAEPHEIETPDAKDATQKVKSMTKLIPLEELSEDTRRQLDIATKEHLEFEASEKEKREKEQKEALTKPEVAERLKKRDEKRAQDQVEKDARLEERKQRDDYKERHQGPYANEIDLISKRKFRFSADVSLYVASYLCMGIHQLAEHGMAKCLEAKRKMFKRKHVFEGGYDELTLSCIFKHLPEFKMALADDRAAELKKAEAKATPVVQTPVAAEAKEAEVEEHDEEDEDDGRNFMHYAKQVCYDVMNKKVTEGKAEYASIRVSKEVRQFFSDLIISAIKTLCHLVEGQLQVKVVSTVSEDIVDLVFETYLRIHNVDVTNVVNEHRSKVATYITFTENRKKEKEAEAQRRDAEAALVPASAPAPSTSSSSS